MEVDELVEEFLSICSVREAFDALKIPFCEFQKALKNAFDFFANTVEFDLKYSRKPRFNENFDILVVRRLFDELFSVPVYDFHKALIKAFVTLAENVQLGLKISEEETTSPTVLNVFVFAMEIPFMQHLDYLEEVLPAFCEAVFYVPVKSQASLVRIFSTYESDCLREKLNTLHQLISNIIIQGWFNKEYCMNNKDMIIGINRLMKIIYYASLLGGEVENLELTGDDNEEHEPTASDIEFAEEYGDQENLMSVRDYEFAIGHFEPTGEGHQVEEQYDDEYVDFEEGDELAPEIIEPAENIFELFRTVGPFIQRDKHMLQHDLLGIELNIKAMNCWKPLLPFSEFYHELLSKQLETNRGFAYVGDPAELSFILTPEVKVIALYYDNSMNMLQPAGIPSNSLKLWVRRDHLIDDALVGVCILFFYFKFRILILGLCALTVTVKIIIFSKNYDILH